MSRVNRKRTIPQKKKRGGIPWRLMMIILVLVLGIGGVAWVWFSGTLSKALLSIETVTSKILRQNGFVLRGILVEGRHHLSKADIQNTLNVQVGAPITTIETRVLQDRLHALPWVEMADVERRLPDHLVVRITERIPIALYQHHGRIDLIDKKGVLIPINDITPFKSLPLVVGENSAINAPAFIDILHRDHSTLIPYITSLVYVSGRRWNLHLTNGIVVRLPEVNQQEALKRLTALLKQKKVFEKDIEILDFRLPKRFIVRYNKKTKRNNKNNKRK